jgi:hypothetical protein
MSLGLGPWQWDIQQTLIWVALAVLLFSFLVTVGMIARRLFARAPARFFGVLILNLLAYGSLALLLAPPSTLSLKEQSVVLLTAGAKVDHPVSEADLFIAPDTRIESETGGSWLLDIGQLSLRRPAINSLKVLGHGLTAEQWTAIPDHVEVDFHAPALNGLVNVNWPGHLSRGEPLLVKGRYRQEENQAAHLELIAPGGGVVDEVELRAGQDFSLSAIPRVAGEHEYRLRLRQEGRVSTEETVAVSVSSGRGARLLVIQSAPSFETRHLKSWAGELGNPLLILTRISKERHISQAVNLPDNADTRLSPALLAGQDLLIMDGRSWFELTVGHREWVTTAVNEGLGLLVLAQGLLCRVIFRCAPSNRTAKPRFPHGQAGILKHPCRIFPFISKPRMARPWFAGKTARCWPCA